MVTITICGIGTAALGRWVYNQRGRKLSDSSHGSEDVKLVEDAVTATLQEDKMSSTPPALGVTLLNTETVPFLQNEASITDPALLKKHSSFQSWSVPTTGFTYSRLRVFHRPHGQLDKLPSKPRPIPLLVFIHGLGGSAAQWNPILTSLVNVASCLAVDLPGCGLSSFKPGDWAAYETGALVHLLATVINSYRDADAGQGVILIGHSMGCSLAALLASKASPHAQLLSDHVLGFIAICPRADPLTDTERKGIKTITSIPAPIFDLMRKWDRRGGIDSKSVIRMTGQDADAETRKLQLRYNKGSRTSVWQRMAFGMANGLPGEDVWAGLQIPVHLFGADADHVTPAVNIDIIFQYMNRDASEKTGNHMVKKYIFPAPASHSVVFSPVSVRSLSGLIGSFLSDHVDQRLSPGWQLQHLTTEGKWDVKNLEKWMKVQAVSEHIANVFRAMKTLREVDASHSPKPFVRKYAGQIYAVVDISYDSPVYDPKGLEDGGIRYFKCPTVSKYPPEREEVETFVSLVDRIREEKEEAKHKGIIAVHCHYGFNRTGFLLVCYLVKRLGYDVKGALEVFRTARPNGIKHIHFIDQLFVRENDGGL
ncbi:hypothetical protein B0J11DRAFT_507947 [Dendryphion nanum]|uniref:Tyrosine specific protein phosphatases domain-containing protein n=1 Tax=Dendryphion nanum TaxID=256645 RepID=A0A9P9DKF3_9PLEO|nr:hypothetical protein B0J11DRAFT_507947 [Dendryphion nanum]